MNNVNNVNNYDLLTCPITGELFVDPISLPCCGQTFSRQSIIDHFRFNSRICPMCRAILSTFNVETASRNVIITNLIERNKLENNVIIEQPLWSAKYYKINNEKYTGEALFNLSVNNIKVMLRPTLFIAVCDCSGSMQGKPWEQVEKALLHMIGVVKTNKLIDLKIITYASMATIIDTNKLTSENIRQIFSSGGTNFMSAFQKIIELLRMNINGFYSDAVIVFLTDGQDSAGKHKLQSDFKAMLSQTWKKDISVHCIGFGTSCDKELLISLQTCGNVNGVFQYATADDDPECLCMKIMNIFKEVETGSNIEVKISNTSPDDLEYIKLIVNSMQIGVYSKWTENILDKINIHTKTESYEITPIIEEIDQKSNPEIFYNWIQKSIDKIASDVLQIGNNDTLMHVSVLRQQIRNIKQICNTFQNETIEFISSQLTNVMNKSVIDIGRLNDLKFSSRFQRNTESLVRHAPVKDQSKSVKKCIAYVEKSDEKLIKHYSRNNHGKNRNALQRLIMNTVTTDIGEQNCTALDIEYTDIDNNNSIHLAVLCGQDKTLNRLCEILKLADKLDVMNKSNADNETPFTISIKKRGFNRTLSVLLMYDVHIPAAQLDSLRRFAIDHKYERTCNILTNIISSGNVSNEKLTPELAKSMTPDYIKFMYNISEDKANYFDVMLSKGLYDYVKKILETYTIKPTIDHLLKWCFPLKPDAPDTDDYLKLARLICKYNSSLIRESNSDGDSPLFKSAERGSLPHTKFFIEKGAVIDQPNKLGNTPLWIACFKRYPCIMKELLNNGADSNHCNIKGNSPLSIACQVGPLKNVDLLIKYGADIETVNTNGDNPVLIACRNGQHEILQLLLKYVDTVFVNTPAHIDGFNAIFASTEANKPECINILHEFGIDINQLTASDNKILPMATPLHLAAYYDRIEATQMLIKLGAIIDTADYEANRQLSPLQIAVIQNNKKVSEILVRAGANKQIALEYATGDIKEILIDKLDISNIDSINMFWNKNWNNIDFADEHGNTPLIYSVLNGNITYIIKLLKLNADPHLENAYRMSAAKYAIWMKNKRIIEIFGISKEIDNLKSSAGLNNLYATTIQKLLVIDGAGKSNGNFESRMNIIETNMGEKNKIMSKMGIMYIGDYIDADVLKYVRLQTVNRIAKGMTINPISIFMSQIYIHNGLLQSIYDKILIEELCNYPIHTGEIFVKLNSRYNVHDIVNVSRPFSGSSLWKLILDNFDVKNGTVGIFISKSARFIGESKSEIVMFPGKYKVIAQYHFDPICLGQCNIRESTFRIKPHDQIKSIVQIFEEQ